MILYVVLHVYGDYIGYFDADVLGVYSEKAAAENCVELNQDKLKVWSEASFIRIYEHNLVSSAGEVE